MKKTIFLLSALLMIVAASFGQVTNRLINIQSARQLISPPNVMWIDSAVSNQIYVAAFGSLRFSTSQITGLPLVYNSSGLVVNQIKKWEGSIAGTSSSGQSIDISSAGFSTILSIQITAKENVSTVKGALVSIKSNTTSAVVVNIYSSKNTGVLIGGNVEGLEFHTVPANVTLFITVTGY